MVWHRFFAPGTSIFLLCDSGLRGKSEKAAAVPYIINEALMYKTIIKRLLDVLLSMIAIVILSPIFFILIIVGSIMMKGNPFFTQERVGYKEHIFKMIKFRTMSNEKDKNGNLLPDDVRINQYGRFLRAASIDELPELFNIIAGHMSIVGPRPLLIKYLPYYTERERLRHSVRPGLTGYAQVHGRNEISWEKKFELDIWYVEHLSVITDIGIFFSTLKVVLLHDGVSLNALEDFDEYRKRSADTNS